MEQVIQALPLLISAAVTVIIAAVRGFVVQHVPSKYFPALLSIGGGLVGAAAHLTGVDATALQHINTDASLWQSTITGVLSGAAATGLHQISKQMSKKE